VGPRSFQAYCYVTGTSDCSLKHWKLLKS
uniref:Uncharacterized protein n=1 Tax=Amphimedon queenslandica TaxID=400682 RepID=A0A1X7TQZ7_AMPQE